MAASSNNTSTNMRSASEEALAGPSTLAADVPVPVRTRRRSQGKRGKQAASSRKRNITWTHIESQVLIRETLPCWMQLCGPRSRETTPEWKRQKWEEIARKVEEHSIARKRRQSGRRGKRVPLLPHEAELLEGIGEEEISQLLAHQDRIQERRRKPRPEEESSSSSSSASTPSLVIMQSEGETEEEEEAEAATPTSAEQEVEETCPGEAAGDAPEGDQPDAADAGSEVFILELHPVDEESNLPASGWPDRPSSAASPGPFHPPVSPPHLDTAMGAASSSSSVPQAAVSPPLPPPPEPHIDYLRRILEVQERQYAYIRRLGHSLGLHNRRQYVALERCRRSLRHLGEQMTGMNMSLQRLLTRSGEDQEDM
ncbi:uncharacterized protein LOC143984114 [Lithobates pipiens]